MPRFFYIRKGKGTLRNAFTNRSSKVGKRQRLLHGKNETFAKKADIRQKWKQKVTKNAPPVRKMSQKVDKKPTLPNRARAKGGKKFTGG